MDSLVVTKLLPKDIILATKIQNIWIRFKDIHHDLKKDRYTKSEVDDFQRLARSFLREFLEIYPSKKVTPYMHVLVFHVPEMLRKHGSISVFEQQGLERLNKIDN